MVKFSLIILSTLIMFPFLSGVSYATNQTSFELPTELQENISTDNITNIIGNLSSFSTRETGTQGCLDASEYIHDWIASNTNASASYQNFTWMGNPTRNVIGEIDGNDSIIIICAYYDSVSDTAIAPGANDDASGVAVGLECLRMLAEYKESHVDLNSKILFIAFSGEEQALAGSRIWVQAHVNENVRGVINLDTIGYGTGQSLIYNIESEWLASNVLISSMSVDLDTYVIKKPLVYPDNSPGDHQSFWNHGIPAIWMYEDGPIYPHFHTERDTINNVNINLLVDAVKIVNAGVFYSSMKLQSINYLYNSIFLIILVISLISVSFLIIYKKKT